MSQPFNNTRLSPSPLSDKVIAITELCLLHSESMPLWNMPLKTWQKACFKWQIFIYFFIILILLALAVKVATAVKKLLSWRRSKSKWTFLISRWLIYVCFFQKFVWLINVRLWTDGRGQSSTKQKMIQGILHSSYKQMFCTVVTSTDLLRHIIIRCQLFWLWLPSWISDGLVCRGPSCLPVISTETEEVDLAHSLCPHFTSTQLHATPFL